MYSKTINLSLVLLFTLASCGDDSSDSGSSTTPNSAINPSGVYTGEQIEIYTANSSNTIVFRDTIENTEFTISGSGTPYTMEYTDPNDFSVSTLSLSLSGNNLSGSGSNDTNDYFEGETYSGTIDGDQLTLNYTGTYDTDTVYTGNFIGNRPATGLGGGTGGGGAGDFLTLSNSSAGSRTLAECDGVFDAYYTGPQSGLNWQLTIENAFELCTDLSAGTYQLNNSSNSSSDLSIELWLQDSQGSPTIELDSKDNGGSITISDIGGKTRYEGTGLKMDDGNSEWTISFRATED